jgi:hypothetical protein
LATQEGDDEGHENDKNTSWEFSPHTQTLLHVICSFSLILVIIVIARE